MGTNQVQQLSRLPAKLNYSSALLAVPMEILRTLQASVERQIIAKPGLILTLTCGFG